MSNDYCCEWLIPREDVPIEIRNFINQIFEVYEIRAKVGSVNGIKFLVHSDEKNHAIPHIHAEYGEYAVSIRIDTGEILAGNLPKKNQKMAQQWVLKHQDELNGIWKNQVISAVSHLTKSAIAKRS